MADIKADIECINAYVKEGRANTEAWMNGIHDRNAEHHKIVERFVEGIHDSLVQKNAPSISKLRVVAELARELVKDYAGNKPENWNKLTDALDAAGYDTGYEKI